MRASISESPGMPRIEYSRSVSSGVSGSGFCRVHPMRRILDHELALVRRHLAQNDLEERRLAAPVRTHDTHAIALVDAERDVGEDVLMSVMNRYSLKVQHVCYFFSAFAFGTPRVRTVTDCTVCGAILTVRVSHFGRTLLGSGS